jgi:release factor glutamine methyltransferase
MQSESQTLLQLLKKTSAFFAGKGLESPRLQAEILLAGVLSCQRLDLYMDFDKTLRADEIDRYRDSVRRRVRHEPLQHIVGSVEFRELELEVNSDVLIPRPETEGLVEVALTCLKGRTTPSVLDLGCGSGAIALAIAQECKAAQITAVDLSAEALQVAQRNAESNGLADRVDWLCGDLWAPLAPEQTYDLIVSNPPYISTADIVELEPEVRDFEPRLALDGGDDGLDFYRRIAVEAAARLNGGGDVVLEIGAGQDSPVGALFEGPQWDKVEIQPDLAGILRVVMVRRVC